MSETASSNRWIPFQCPTCFGLFRIKKSQVGQTGRCPVCNAAVQSSESENLGVLNQAASSAIDNNNLLARVAVAQEMTSEQLRKAESGIRGRRRQYVGEEAGGMAWEEEEASDNVSWKVVVSIVLSAFVLLALSLVYYKNVGLNSSAGSTKPEINREQADSWLDDIEKADRNTKKIEEGETAAKDVDNFEKFDNAKVEKAIRNFVTAKSPAELKKYIRNSERVGPLLDRYYEKVDYEVEGFEALDMTQMRYNGDVVTMFVQKADFLSSPIAVERIVDGEEESYLIDWESWVGYCDYTPEQMRMEKPDKPFLMRVLVQPASYYNYEFSDDGKWRSLGLELKDSIYSFLGYVERDSEQDKRFRVMMKGGKVVACMVRVAYPTGSRSKDQVEILEIVGSGWLQNLSKDNEDD
ncbi:hypothetical protein N8643_01010 [bacterium]|nr:hypothetical protein [bacterium]MDA7682552.1 hypothetical protein [Akkermansiaceae bacterium]MDA8959334.1 hypothetical protein [bacterium]MDA8973796.1 hypothetical protein [Akkermansiaceae bacterium]MDB4389972.1 hypothetical protein [Akkermansiaceae bacterium]